MLNLQRHIAPYIGNNDADGKALGRRSKQANKRPKRSQDLPTSDNVSNPTTPASTTPVSSSVASISPSNLGSRESSVALSNGQSASATATSTAVTQAGIAPADGVPGGATVTASVAYTGQQAASTTASSQPVADQYGDYTGYQQQQQHTSYQQQQSAGQHTPSYHDIDQLTSASSRIVAVPQSAATSTTVGSVSGQSTSFVTSATSSGSASGSGTTASDETTERASYNLSQFQQQQQPQQQGSGADLSSLDAHLAASAAVVASHHQHQFTPTFANHHHQHQDSQRQVADQLTLNYHSGEAASTSSANQLAAHHLQQQPHQSQQQYHQHQAQQALHQYNSVASTAMPQHSHHHDLMIEQHYVNAMAAGNEQQARSTCSPSAQNLMSSIGMFPLLAKRLTSSFCFRRSLTSSLLPLE